MEEAFPAARPRATKPSGQRNVATVTTTARLHFGFLDPSGRGKRPFGSFGLSLDRPRTKLVLRRAERSSLSGAEAMRAGRYLAAIAERCRITQSYDLRLDEAIPPHAGLGSGTQLALAVGSAFAALEGLALSPAAIAERLGRGARSGIGIGTFAQGGLVLDGGPGQGGSLPLLISRLPFPEPWRVILIFDESTAGLSGADEISAFEALPAFPDAETAMLSQRVQTALAAVEGGNFAGFCDQIGALQTAMGAYFGALQGGVFVSRAVGEAVGWLRSQGLTGLGQSSWGPTGFAFVRGEKEGLTLLAQLQERGGAGLHFELAQGRNEGAEIALGHRLISAHPDSG